jgi:outer membrane protein TolC
MVLRATQPLLRGRGAGVNLATVRIAETRLNQTRIKVEATMQAQLRSIEQVYWLLHASHVQLQAINEAIEAAHKTLTVANERFKAERALYSDVARASVRLEDFYQQKLSAELAVQRSTLDLAQLVGLELTNAIVFVPTDMPEFREPNFDVNEITASAINNNLAIQARRAEITIRQNNLVVASNQLLPQFDALALHRTSGLDGDLGTSLQQMMSLEFNDFSLGLQYTQQLGYRQGKSRTQVARLELARETAILQAAERQVGFEIIQLLNELKQSYGRYQSALRQFEQAQKWVEVAKRRYEDPPLNVKESLLVLLLDYQTATQEKINAISQVAKTLAEYNANLAIVEEKRGMLLEKWNIQTGSPSPLPIIAK